MCPRRPNSRTPSTSRAVARAPGTFDFSSATTAAWHIARDVESRATVNLVDDTWSYWPKPMPRVTGKSTRVVITEYEMPRKPLLPHDVIIDGEGIAWFTQFDEQKLGRFAPKTLKLTEF